MDFSNTVKHFLSYAGFDSQISVYQEKLARYAESTGYLNASDADVVARVAVVALKTFTTYMLTGLLSAIALSPAAAVLLTAGATAGTAYFSAKNNPCATLADRVDNFFNSATSYLNSTFDYAAARMPNCVKNLFNR